MKKPLLECCVDTVESAVAAKEGGADRLELCANLIIGGTTPDINLYHRIREKCDILINPIIRPRFGDVYKRQAVPSARIAFPKSMNKIILTFFSIK